MDSVGKYSVQIQKFITFHSKSSKFQRLYSRKYSVQIQKFKIQKVKPIRSEWIPAKNIRFKFKSLKFKGLTLYVRNRFWPKIFGLKL